MSTASSYDSELASRLLAGLLALMLLRVAIAPASAETRVANPISFAQEVLPILSDRCFRCHGPDDASRQAGLRLDLRETAVAHGAVIPGDAESSEMIVRITSADAEIQMPPPGAGVPDLGDDQIDVLKSWINQGGEWEEHWAFVAPKRSELPQVSDVDWIKNSIDHFVLSKLESKGISPSPTADKPTLARRVALLLTGLPPSLERIAGFCEDDSPDAYETFVDSLLADEAYGERMAAAWMDLARYSDTDGFQADEPRTNWPWRDWVISAYNANKPFDEFTLEQFAGDLLPNATEEQILATGFHRHHMTNGEGGRDPAESRVDYVLDRVNTVGTAWLGLTLGCAQCHSHKYDPITQKEYYQLSAFFNSIDEDGRAGSAAKPYLQWRLPNADVLLEEPERQLAARERELAALQEETEARFSQWLDALLLRAPSIVKGVQQADWRVLDLRQPEANDPEIRFEQEEDGVWRVSSGEPSNVTYTLVAPVTHDRVGAVRVEALSHESFTAGGLAKSNSGNFVLTDVIAHLIREPAADSTDSLRIPIRFTSAWADYEQPHYPIPLSIDSALDTGWAVLSSDMTQPRTAVFRLDRPVPTQPGDLIEIQLVHFSHHAKHNIGRLRVSTSPEREAQHPTILTEVLESSGDEAASGAQQQALRNHYLAHDGALNQAQRRVTDATQALEDAKQRTTVAVMVLKERDEPRDAFVLERGIWNSHGEKVQATTPAALEPLQTNEGQNRLDLAKWLVDRRNPLTARVAVNRYWQMYFGAGLVRTPEDFGVQGERPTHPQLLDWLAVEFMESGWNVKHIQRLIVTSATFQQSSDYTAELLARDPRNRFMARGPRFRMPAAMIRDSALKISGLLSEKRGGPPVKPYQPENVWAASDQGRYPYVLAKGPNLYRRSLYTYWRRNISPPGMFDAAQRRVCEVNVRRTNSPMHALTLLNDTTYVEGARVLAQSAMRNEISISDQVHWMLSRVMLRVPADEEQALLVDSAIELEQEYSTDPELARQLLAQGDHPLDEPLDSARLAALTVVASTIFNTDEFLSIE